MTLTSAGTPDTALRWGSVESDSATAVLRGDVPTLAGTFSASVDFDPFGGVATSSGSSDLFVIRHALP